MLPIPMLPIPVPPILMPPILMPPDGGQGLGGDAGGLVGADDRVRRGGRGR